MRRKVFSKISAVVLAASMILTQMPVEVMAMNPDYAVRYAGTEDELIAAMKGSIDERDETNVVLTDDIELSNKWSLRSFKGTLDGKGHMITINAQYSDSGNIKGGFIKTLYKNAEIKNLIFKGNASNLNGIGGIIEEMQASKLSSCVIDMGVSGNTTVGGIIGTVTSNAQASPVIENCCFIGTAVEESEGLQATPAGGIIGKVTGGNPVIRNCYTTANRLVGNNAGAAVENSYDSGSSLGLARPESMDELIAALNAGGGNYEMGSNGYPIPVMTDSETDDSIESVTLNQSSAEMETGDELELEATVTGTASNLDVTWSSDNAEVATVDNGLVKALKEGTATIKAASDFDDTKYAECTITVTEPENIAVTGVTLDESAIEMDIDEMIMLTVAVLPEDATNQKVTWETSDADIASVEDGAVTAKAAGKATITVTTEDGGKTAECLVTVKEAAPVTATEISTEAELKAIKDNPNGNYILKNDIELTEAWTPVDFTGSFDGNGHVIREVNISGAEAGFFRTLNNGAVVKNFGLEGKVTYNGSKDGAGLVGELINGSLSGCYVNMTVDAGSKDYAGFLVGRFAENAQGTIENCYGTGTITVYSNPGLIGSASSATNVTVQNCYTYRENGRQIRLIGTNHYAAIKYSNNYATKSCDFVEDIPTDTNDDYDMNALLTNLNANGNDAYKADENSLNNGWPLLKWQVSEPQTVAVESVSLDRETLELTEGTEAALKATVSPEDATNTNVSWKSSDETVAKVADGEVTAVKAGTATITVTTEDGEKTAACEVIVKAANVPVTGITLNKTTANADVNDVITLKATVQPDNATNKTVTWESDKPEVAAVTNGKVTAKTAGTAVITATTAEGGFTASCTVTVAKPTIEISTARELFAMGQDANYILKKDIEITAEDDWKPIKNFIGSLDGQGHTISVNGSFDSIYAAALFEEAGEGASIKNLYVTGSIVNDNSSGGACGGLIGKITGKNVTISNCAVNMKIRSQFGDAGLIAARVETPCVIENCYAVGNVSGGQAGGIVGTLWDEEAVIRNCYTTAPNLVGSARDYNASASKSNYAKNASGTLASALPENMEELLAGINGDNAFKADEGFVNAGYPVLTWQESMKVPVTGITLDKKEVTLEEGNTAQLTASFSPENASDKRLIWNSSNEASVAVKDGVITAVKAGEAVITVTSVDGNFSDSCMVTVTSKEPTKVPVTAVKLDKETAELKAGETVELTAVAEPDNASNKNVFWSTSDAGVASVENGVVTAVAEGTAVITVTTEDGGFTAACTITVKANDPNPDPNPDPDPNPGTDEEQEGTIVDSKYGFSLTGKGITSDMELLVTPLAKDSDAVELMRKQISTAKALTKLYDIKLLKDGEEIDFPDDCELGVRVDAKYNGKTMDVLFLKDKEISKLSGKVEDGVLKVTLSGSGSIGMVVDMPASGGNAANTGKDDGKGTDDGYGGKGTVKTGDETTAAVWILLAGLAAASAVIAGKKKKLTFNQRAPYRSLQIGENV